MTMDRRIAILAVLALIGGMLGCVAMAPKRGAASLPGDAVPKAETPTVTHAPPAQSRDAWIESPEDDLCSRGEFPELPDDMTDDGVRSEFVFVTQDATRDELVVFIRKVEQGGFGWTPLTVKINGRDTVFVSGMRALLTEKQLRDEYLAACALRVGEHIYMLHVRHNDASQQSGPRRVW